MPRSIPEPILERFSSYLQETVRAALDDEFVDGPVGSMSSTLSFLAEALGRKRAVTERQREALVEVLREAEAICENGAVEDAAIRARERVAEASPGGAGELETVLVEHCSDVFDAINAELDDEAARAAREPLYEFPRVRSRAS